MFIPIILGTAREGRQSEKVANFMLAEVKKAGIESEILDVRNFRLPASDNSETSPEAQKLAEKILKSQALIIVSPEYNHSFPGELKMMLDMLYEQYAGKPVAICGVSVGGFGGMNAIKQLQLLVIKFGMLPLRDFVAFSNVGELFNENGEINNDSYSQKAQVLIGKLRGFVETIMGNGSV